MKVDLTPRYRAWMWLLLPSTLGFGTAALWARSLNWPRAIDAESLTLRSRRKISWREVRAIAVHRDYVDGCIFHLDIQATDGKWRIPISVLDNGQRVAATIVAMFKQSRRARRAPVDPSFIRSPTLQPTRYTSQTTHTLA
jgi:hypothetical protein